MVRALTSYSDASSRALRRRGAQARSSSTSAYSRSVRFTFRPYDLVPTNSAGRAGTRAESAGNALACRRGSARRVATGAGLVQPGGAQREVALPGALTVIL